MKIQTFYLLVDYGHGDRVLYSGLSRVALEHYKDWFREEPAVFNMHYGKEINHD